MIRIMGIKIINFSWRKWIFVWTVVGCLFTLIFPQTSFAGIYFSLGAGAVANLAQGDRTRITVYQQQAPQFPAYYTYQNAKPGKAFIAQVGIGYRWQFKPRWSFRQGIRLSQYSLQQKGNGDLQNFAFFSYRYNIDVTQLEQVFRITYMQNKLGYFVEAQIGVSVLKADSYYQPLDGSQNYGSYADGSSKTNLSYGFGLGTSYHFNKHTAIDIGINFSALGKVSLGNRQNSYKVEGGSIEQHVQTIQYMLRITHLF